MAKQQKETVLVTDLPLGTILKFKGTKGSAYRKLYKIQHSPARFNPSGLKIHDGWYSLWGILMNHHQKDGLHTFTEDCGMTSNGLDKVTHQVICEGGQMELRPIQIVTPEQLKEGLV